MKPPAIGRIRGLDRRGERGVTMVLVAIAMVAIIAMAALSIDVVTLYLARVEAQRTADAAALAAARVIALSGLTGDPSNAGGAWASICGAGPLSPATQAAKAVANQGTVGSIPATVTVTYSAGGSSPSSDCSALTAGGPFGVNPMVTVNISRAGLPTFFSRMWGNTGNSVSATATAEAFNPSNSGNVGNGVTGTIIPVAPRCVKPLIIPNRDPNNPGQNANSVWCDNPDPSNANAVTPCNPFVSLNDGSITHAGIALNGGASLSGSVSSGVIGETLYLTPDCHHNGGTCSLRATIPQANYWPNTGVRSFIQQPPNLQYLPGAAPSATPVAVPSCARGSLYREAVGGCDNSTVYQCGVQSSSNQIDLSENPGKGTDDVMTAVTCLINEGDATDTQPDGQDTINLTSYPFQILAGTSNPLLGSGLSSGNPVTSSPSIVTVPIYDSTAVTTINGTSTTNVTIVGFLHVFINSVDNWGNVQVTVLNVAGCSNGGGTDPVGTAVNGTSPVPVRLITPP